MNSASLQPLVLAPAPRAATYLAFELVDRSGAENALIRLRKELSPEQFTIGLSAPLVNSFGGEVPGLASYSRIEANGVSFPDAQRALWVSAPGEDLGTCFDRATFVEQLLTGGFVRRERVEGFKYREGRDLSGYIDGTANPDGEEAVAAVRVTSGPQVSLGGTFVLVQMWKHDLSAFRSRSQVERDHTIGRRLSDNEEIADAPAAAHVKRTAMEEFDPPATIVRRSMPWSSAGESGLYFVAFANALIPFEKLLRKMVGESDGITDALFSLSKPLSSAYYFAPPIRDGRFDLSALGL